MNMKWKELKSVYVRSAIYPCQMALLPWKELIDGIERSSLHLLYTHFIHKRVIVNDGKQGRLVLEINSGMCRRVYTYLCRKYLVDILKCSLQNFRWNLFGTLCIVMLVTRWNIHLYYTCIQQYILEELMVIYD